MIHEDFPLIQAKMEHVSVLKNDVQKYLELKSGDVVVDATLGLGGHSLDILNKIGEKGVLMAFEQDERNLKEAQERLKDYKKQTVYFNDNFRYLKSRVTGAGHKKIDAILFDLGLSSPHVDDAERGFSFMKDGPLDMRFDQKNKLTAELVINTYPEELLANVFYNYGEERMSRKLARAICTDRKITPFTSTTQLAGLIERVLAVKKHGKVFNPAARIFQSIRIEVNDEMNVLKEALSQAMELLDIGGRIVIMSYHSLEDRIVKQFFKNLERPPVKSQELSIYQNYDDPIVEVLTKKPVVPTDAEIAQNTRSRSAKLRAYKKIKEYTPEPVEAEWSK
ncbi:MAG: 16S rRNA (cytosine(1402)-N(4))-methyltransferase RsmH [Candidatus Peregrinibacteria bacterium]|nr:16S rRNA (cytosine(1402)-N(4))-methyltransferase RsmH [Candidatus Peregrinibacteria bacterium]